MAMILAAGWTIERRQRNGREYMDAVYVCPEGKTHWSVTKAYKALQEGCENDDPKVCKNGFKFTPLPPEELSMLQRVVVNKRVGKKGAKKGKGGGEGKNNVKLKKAKDGNTSDEGIEEKRKKKLGKSQKGKRLLLEQGASTSTACEGRLSMVQHHKRQKTQNRKRCALLVRNSENADSENGGYIPYDGKRTVLSWMIDLGTLSLNSKLKYMNRRKRQVLLEGRIARDGIHCGCCKEIISISEFVIHTRTDYSEPLKYIFTESGSSLLQCLLASWNKQEESEHLGFHFVEVNREDPNDDTCGICGDGGDLICCDGCPSTFHQSCLEIKKFPSGDWHCVYCSCKFCGMFGNTCQRDGSENTAASAFLTCLLCEEKYHQCCNEAKDAVNDDSSSPPFCGKNCQELFEKLEMLLGVRHEVEEGFSLTLLRRFDVGDTALETECDAKLIECNAKLAVAFLIMDECFLPMVDHRSGVNLIHNILYNRGSNFNRLNYGGFFTAILERGDEILCAATIRIHGNYLAEMPFIGTRYMYRRQGMCRRLLTAIESALCSLKVERLVIPAISELRETWTSVFGFESLEESSKQKMKNMNVLVFPGVDILQKPLLNRLTEANKSPVQGLRFTDLEHLKTMKDVVCNTDEGRLAGFDGEATALCVDEGNDELAAAQSNTLLHFDVPDVRAVELGTKRNQPEVLCDTDEGLLAGSDAEASASCRHEATGVSHDNLDRTNNTITIPSGSVSDVHEQTEEINEYQNSDSVPDVKELELDTKHNQHSISEVERKSHLKSEGNGSAIEVICASVEGTDNIDYNMRIEDDSVKHISSHAEENNASELQNVALVQEAKVSNENIVHSDSEITSQISHNEENNALELQNVALVHVAKVSDEDIVHNDSEITTHISHDAKDHNHHDSQHLQLKGSMFCPNEKMLETFEVEYNHSSVQHTSIVMEGVHPDSIMCSDSKILTEASKFGNDVFHQTAPLAPKKADDSKGHSTTLLFGCSISYFSGNGPDTHEVVSTPADNNFLPSCGANLESNGISKSPDDDLTSNGAQMNTRSLQQSESDSDVDNSSLRQSNLSNTSAVALQCASGGGNSFGASEVTILSNQGQAN